MTWERKLAACFLLFALLIAMSTCYAYSRIYERVMCPPNWRIIVAQRYDKRDAKGWITERRWIARCV